MMRKIREIFDLCVVTWLFGGGAAAALLMLALFGWRAATGCLAVWMFSVIGAATWLILYPANTETVKK